MGTDDGVLRLHPDDNVGVALRALAAGATLPAFGIDVADDVPQGHKVALAPIAAGAAVRKFGQAIGRATAAIDAGQHVHVHNVAVDEVTPERAAGDYATAWPPSDERRFDGYHRADGRVGTRNYVGIVSTVNCSATVVRKIAAHFTDERLAAYPNVSGLVPVTHTSGCGMSARGEGLDLLQRTLRGFIGHANFGGVLVIGLGCEVNEVGRLLDREPGLTPGPALRTMTIQDAGGTLPAIEQGIAAVQALLELANETGRQPASAAHLALGLQCGGSDGYSAISANPALGVAADRLVRAGGRVILAETPEIHGAEHLLYARAESPEVVAALQARLAWWQDYVQKNGATLDNNPSPGNIAGGITTILEKSLGAVAKSGRSPLRAVIGYAEPVSVPGFSFMDSPGYDPCSVTGEIAAGANVVCFTTGRGSVFGAKPAPSIKLATNSALAERMSGDMDYDCGTVLDGRATLESAGEQIFELILEVASGRATASERSGFGDLEFVPWQLGAVL